MSCPSCQGSSGLLSASSIVSTVAHTFAVYGEFEAVIDIETGGVISGKLPKRALGLISEWQNAHKAELSENWKLAREHKTLKKIPPLE